MKAKPVPALFLAALAWTQAASAADIEAQLNIDTVTVYRQGAAVTRTGSVSFPAGEHRLIVRGLPAAIDPASLRVSAASGRLRLGGVEIEQVIATDLVNEAENVLSNQLQDLQDQRTAIQDRVLTARTQLSFIDQLIRPPAEGEGGVQIDSAALPATLSAIGAGVAGARAEIRDANILTRELDEEIAAVEAELQKVRTESRSTTQLRATVVAGAAVSAPVSVEYRVEAAGWQWLYEARLDTEDSTLEFARQASISQGSGEDWRNVELAVTTATPLADATTPPVTSQFLRLRDYPREPSRMEEVIVTSSRTRSFGRQPQDRAAPAQAARIVADEFATDFVAEYRIPGRVNIGADRQTRVYPIAEDAFEPELVARAVMPAGPDARLEATFQYESDAPIEAGRVQLYRDGAYMGDAVLPLLLPGADVRMPFGVDDRIQIAVRNERTDSGERGLGGRQELEEWRQRYEVTSFHASAIPIEIIDRVPVPQDSDIDVEVLDGATPPTVEDYDGKEGVYLWRLDGTPRVTETIRHYYSIRYPSDRMLVPVEGVP